jgi:hypothetical protein
MFRHWSRLVLHRFVWIKRIPVSLVPCDDCQIVEDTGTFSASSEPLVLKGQISNYVTVGGAFVLLVYPLHGQAKFDLVVGSYTTALQTQVSGIQSPFFFVTCLEVR